MTKRQLQSTGPLGLEPSEWRRYAVDGDEDGRIRHADPADSAATLARLIWSQGSLRAGLFAHNHAEWYVQAVLGETERMKGACQVDYVDWSVALPAAAGSYVNPFALSTGLVTGRIDQGVDFDRRRTDRRDRRSAGPGDRRARLAGRRRRPLPAARRTAHGPVDLRLRGGRRHRAGRPDGRRRSADRHLQAPAARSRSASPTAPARRCSHAEYFEGKVTQHGLEMFSLLQALGVIT